MVLPEAHQENPLSAAFSELVGVPAWHVTQGYGSYPTLNFGTPHLWVQEADPSSRSRLRRKRLVRVRGHWCLWITDCNWRIRIGNRILAHSESSRKKIETGTREVDGQALTSVTVDPQNRTSCFLFDEGGSIEIWPYSEDDIESPKEPSSQWSLITQTSPSLSHWFNYSDEGKFSLNDGNRKSVEDVWLTMKEVLVVR
jgi:hypothetical protein